MKPHFLIFGVLAAIVSFVAVLPHFNKPSPSAISSSVPSHSSRLAPPIASTDPSDNSSVGSFQSNTTSVIVPYSTIRNLDVNPQGSSVSWKQVGNSIGGEAAGDLSGHSVGISDDGRRVVIGAPLNDGNGDRSGHARVYQEMDGTWVQVGEDLDGEAAGDVSGESVGISGDGSKVVIGATGNDGNGDSSGHARVYQDMNGTWVQVGEDLDGEAAGDSSAELSVGISDDGRKVVIGASMNDGNAGDRSGHARVYQDIDGTWVQVGEDLDGEAACDFSGHSVGISGDGSRVVIGAPYNDGNGLTSGHARVYQDMDGTWVQVGEDLDGEAAHDSSGLSVGISGDGSKVVIGAPWNDGNGDYSGHARVYQDIDGTWVQVGEDLDGEAADNGSGLSVGISGDGSRVVMGAPWNSVASGHARVYQDIDGTWVQVGEDLDGEAADDESGYSVGISGDGSRVVIGAPWNAGNGFESGQVMVFALAPPTEAPTERPDSSGIEVPIVKVGKHLGGELYFSYKNDSKLQTCAEMVYKEIQKRRRMQEDEWVDDELAEA